MTPGHCCKLNDSICKYANGQPDVEIGTVEKIIVTDRPPTVDVALVNLDMSVCQKVCNRVLIDKVDIHLCDGIAHDTNGMVVQKFRTGPVESGTVCHKVIGNPQTGEFVDCICVIHQNGENSMFHDKGESGCLVTTKPISMPVGGGIASGVAILMAIQTTKVNGNLEYYSLAVPPPLTVLRKEQRFASLCVPTSDHLIGEHNLDNKLTSFRALIKKSSIR